MEMVNIMYGVTITLSVAFMFFLVNIVKQHKEIYKELKEKELKEAEEYNTLKDLSKEVYSKELLRKEDKFRFVRESLYNEGKSDYEVEMAILDMKMKELKCDSAIQNNEKNV